MYEYLYIYRERDYRYAKFIDDNDVKVDFILNPKINRGRLIRIYKYTWDTLSRDDDMMMTTKYIQYWTQT